MNLLLRLKARIIGTPVEPVAAALRRAAAISKAFRYPELAELHREHNLLGPVLRRLVAHNSNCLDVGCHIGSFLSAVQIIAPAGSHIAIEPTPSKAAWLRRKFPSVTIHEVAAGDDDGTALFEDNQDRSGYSKLLSEVTTEDRVVRYEVQVRKLDSLVSSHVDLIKLDTEGNEAKVLLGASRLIAVSRPTIIFECGSEYEPGATMRRKEVFDLLTSYQYSVHTFSDIIFQRGAMDYNEFRRCGLYPFRAFNFIAKPT